MNNRISRRMALAGLLSSAATLAFADAPLTSVRPVARPGAGSAVANPGAPPLRPTIDEMIAEAGLTGVLSFVLADAQTGEVLAQKNPGVALPPASVAKALTAQYALSVLGAEHRFVTRVLITGPVVDGHVKGDLILAGGADPTLSADHLAEMAKALALLGITGADGFAVWAGALPKLPEIDPDQQDHLGYNPTISGLNMNFNQVHFEWKRGGGDYRVTMDARTENRVPNVTTSAMRIVDRGLPVYTYGSVEGLDQWTVARSALGEGGARWLPVRNPAAYAAEVFGIVAKAEGITLPAPEVISALPGGIEVARHESPALSRMLKDMLLYSTNLTAEILGLSATLARGVEVSSLASSARAMNRWYRREYGVGTRLVDHSGLSDDSRVSTGEMVKMLQAVGASSPLAGLMKTIGMVDSEGRTMEDHPARVHAKTGTLNFVTTLAGYLEGPGARPMVFAIFAADLEARAAGQAAGDEVPQGSRRFNSRAKRLRQRMLQRWGLIYSA